MIRRWLAAFHLYATQGRVADDGVGSRDDPTGKLDATWAYASLAEPAGRGRPDVHAILPGVHANLGTANPIAEVLSRSRKPERAFIVALAALAAIPAV